MHTTTSSSSPFIFSATASHPHSSGMLLNAFFPRHSHSSIIVFRKHRLYLYPISSNRTHHFAVHRIVCNSTTCSYPSSQQAGPRLSRHVRPTTTRVSNPRSTSTRTTTTTTRRDWLTFSTDCSSSYSVSSSSRHDFCRSCRYRPFRNEPASSTSFLCHHIRQVQNPDAGYKPRRRRATTSSTTPSSPRARSPAALLRGICVD